MTDRPPAFATSFVPGHPITDEKNFSEFHRFHPPTPGQTPVQYAEQLQALGLALHLTSEQVRDIGLFKETMRAARADGIPVAVTTGGAPSMPESYDPAAEAQAKTDALAQARATTR